MADSYGLLDLSNAERLLVEQKTEVFQSRKRYKIKNERGRIVYYMVDEPSGCLSGSSSMNILNLNQQEVIYLSRQRSCESVSCFPLCCGSFQKLEVRSYCGDLLGRVDEIVGWSAESYDVKDGSGNIVFKIKKAPGSCCRKSVEFKILSPDKSTEIGQIIKRWGNLRQEKFSKVDHFGVSFPFDLDVHIKAVLMGACFMIHDFHFKEGRRR
ncbi:phospholipid scramblase 2-like [Planococcus citri]|uniref:phospholipid scramblase 2-like n=1 Tax=Planococcus citri TaxID=170843 RepID=UPI0031F80870